MFRISGYMNLVRDYQNNLAIPTPRKSKMPGPVVIWNLIRRCNLACKHCYTSSGDADYPNELTTEQVFSVMQDMYDFGVRVLILSGGEPLLRPDIFDISKKAKQMGFYVGLSSNGTKINQQNIDKIEQIGFNYVGISLDGLGKTHDAFRRKAGAFDEALNGIRLCLSRNIKVGVRYCLNQDTQNDFARILDFVVQEKIDKFYLSHLNYSGRGYSFRKIDSLHKTTRSSILQLFEFAWSNPQVEVVTGNNDADAVFFLHWLEQKFPELVPIIRPHLVGWGGNSTGVNIANIDNEGNVHPDSFWWSYNLGSVKERKFSEIWSDRTDPLIDAMRQSPRQIKGSCSQCQNFDICNGNTRIRAYQLTKDFLQEDPGCYLTNSEIGVPSSFTRLVESLDIRYAKRGLENEV